MLKKRSDQIHRVQNQFNIQQITEQLEALLGLVGEFIFEVILQLTAQTIVTALYK